MKAIILAVVVAVGLGAGVAHANAHTYRTPAHNYYQNNWMSG
jgi:hypothetical protein